MADHFPPQDLAAEFVEPSDAARRAEAEILAGILRATQHLPPEDLFVLLEAAFRASGRFMAHVGLRDPLKALDPQGDPLCGKLLVALAHGADAELQKPVLGVSRTAPKGRVH